MKMISWNVNGIRAGVKKGFVDKFKELKADIFCIQETKAQDEQVMEALNELDDWHIYSTSAVKKGYSGVAIISREPALSVTKGIGLEEHDQEGRVVAVEYEDYYLINVYVPNSGNGLKRLDYRSEWDKAFAIYLSNLKKKKPIIVTGDFNVAHEAIDLARPKQNYNKTSGYTQKEIDGLDGILEVGLFDSYRTLHPEKVEYTFWSQRFGAREKNVGWRIDYFLVDKNLSANVTSAYILNDIMGSDHCPLGLELEI
jgi:exodeoxyribonuclease-3